MSASRSTTLNQLQTPSISIAASGPIAFVGTLSVRLIFLMSGTTDTSWVKPLLMRRRGACPWLPLAVPFSGWLAPAGGLSILLGIALESEHGSSCGFSLASHR